MVERNLAKVEVASSRLVSRSKHSTTDFFGSPLCFLKGTIEVPFLFRQTRVAPACDASWHAALVCIHQSRDRGELREPAAEGGAVQPSLQAQPRAWRLATLATVHLPGDADRGRSRRPCVRGHGGTTARSSAALSRPTACASRVTMGGRDAAALAASGAGALGIQRPAACRQGRTLLRSGPRRNCSRPQPVAPRIRIGAVETAGRWRPRRERAWTVGVA